ncbi:la-related protein 1B-like, partial [Hibiscus syriacus]|uniref:la-related protein 1B-like n=1 Tax=Hibiscus syriacus TaxID=106335 RepID=UPI001923E618
QRTVFVPFTGGNDQRPPQNSFRPRHSVPHQRGEGSHHLNYGGRHHQYRGNQNWNSRNFINRDIQPRGVPRFMRHPPPPPPPINTGALFAPSHVHSFGPPMGFHEYSTQLYLIPAPHQELYRGVSYFQPVHPMFLPTDFQHQQLHAKILNQINYYFSNENLIKDTFLRQNMDDQGWVHVKLIAGFRKVSFQRFLTLTNNIQVIVDALKNSTVVEVQGDKIRRQNDWKRWILPPSVQFSTKPGQDVPVAGVRSISSEQGTTNNQIGSMS